jgi:sugar phosphate isomerase/epimerase
MFRNLSAAALGVVGQQNEIIELALTYGFQGLDIDIAEFATRAKLRGGAYARRLIESANLQVGSFVLPVELDADEELFTKKLEKLPEYVNAAGEIGCRRCVTTIAPSSDTRPYHENFELHRRRIGQVCKVLEPAAVRLGIGFRGATYARKGSGLEFIHGLEALLMLIQMAPGENVGLNLDVWEVLAEGGSLDSIRGLSARQIVAVDVANLPAGVTLDELDDHSRLLPGAEGAAVDMASVLAMLAQLGYDGPVTPRPSRTALKNLRRDLAVRETSESLTKVWKAAGLPAKSRPLAASRS